MEWMCMKLMISLQNEFYMNGLVDGTAGRSRFFSKIPCFHGGDGCEVFLIFAAIIFLIFAFVDYRVLIFTKP
jgi:hypothetical protein